MLQRIPVETAAFHYLFILEGKKNILKKMQVVTEYKITSFLCNIKKIFIQLSCTSITLFFLAIYTNSVVFRVYLTLFTTYYQTTATQALSIKDKKSKELMKKQAPRKGNAENANWPMSKSDYTYYWGIYISCDGDTNMPDSQPYVLYI